MPNPDSLTFKKVAGHMLEKAAHNFNTYYQWNWPLNSHEHNTNKMRARIRSTIPLIKNDVPFDEAILPVIKVLTHQRLYPSYQALTTVKIAIDESHVDEFLYNIPAVFHNMRAHMPFTHNENNQDPNNYECSRIIEAIQSRFSNLMFYKTRDIQSLHQHRTRRSSTIRATRRQPTNLFKENFMNAADIADAYLETLRMPPTPAPEPQGGASLGRRATTMYYIDDPDPLPESPSGTHYVQTPSETPIEVSTATRPLTAEELAERDRSRSTAEAAEDFINSLLDLHRDDSSD